MRTSACAGHWANFNPCATQAAICSAMDQPKKRSGHTKTQNSAQPRWHCQALNHLGKNKRRLGCQFLDALFLDTCHDTDKQPQRLPFDCCSLSHPPPIRTPTMYEFDLPEAPEGKEELPQIQNDRKTTTVYKVVPFRKPMQDTPRPQKLFSNAT